MFGKLISNTDKVFRDIFGVESKKDPYIEAIKNEAEYSTKMNRAINSTNDEYIKDQLRIRLANNVYEYEDLISDDEINNQNSIGNDVTI